jgi:ParB family chromosome partitioning protein
MAALGLLKDVRSRTGTKDGRAVALTVRDIPVGDIEMRENVRKAYTGIEELAESIRQHGLLQPIIVYNEGDGFVVKTGHRRFLACKLLFADAPEQFHSIRCLVSDKKNVAIIQLVENVQREDLSQFDLHNALSALRDLGMSHREIALAMGKTEGYVKNLFVGVNEVTSNRQLGALLKSHAGVTLQDVNETRCVPDTVDRLKLLKQREGGKINRAEMREQVKALKTGGVDAGVDEVVSETSPDIVAAEPTVKIAVSEDGLRVKLVFTDRGAAGLMARGIRRLAGRHGIGVVDV